MSEYLSVEDAVSAAVSAMDRGGKAVEITTDFTEIALQMKMAGREISVEAHPDQHELSSDDAAYIVLRGRDRQIDGFCALRMAVVGNEMLAGHIDHLYRHLYNKGRVAIDVTRLPEIVHEAKGRIVLVSDLFVRPGKSIARNVDAAHLMVLALGTALLRFNPDFVYGSVNDAKARRGLLARYLCTRNYYGAFRWQTDVVNRRNDDWLVLMTEGDCHYILRNYVELPPTVNLRQIE